MPYSYYQLRDVYDHLKSTGVVTETLPEWAASQNEATGTKDFDSGVDEGYVVKPFFNAVRNVTDWSGLPDVGASIGSMFGDKGEAVGRSAFQSIPNLLPMLLSGPAAPIVGMSLMAAGDTYTETDDTGSALLSGAIGAVMPGVANKAEQWALKRLGGEFVEGVVQTGKPAISQYFANNLGQGIASQAAGQVGASFLGEGGRIAESFIRDEAYDFDPERIALEMTLGQLPFAAFQVSNRGGRVAFGGEATREHVASLRKQIAETEVNTASSQILTASKLEAVARQNVTLTPEQKAREAELLTPKPDMNLVAQVQAANDAMAAVEAGTMSKEAAAEIVTKANISLSGKEHLAVYDRQKFVDSQPKLEVDGSLEYKTDKMVKIFVDDTESNRALGLPIGKFVEFPAHSEDLGKSVGEAGKFKIPTDEKYRTVAIGDAELKDQQRKLARSEEIASKSKLETNPDLPAKAENEEAFNKWQEDRRVVLEEQRAKLEKANKSLAETFTLLSNPADSPAEKVKLLQSVYDTYKEAGLLPLSSQQLAEYSKALSYNDKTGLVSVIQVAKKTVNGQEAAFKAKEKRDEKKADKKKSDIETIKALRESKLPEDIAALKQLDEAHIVLLQEAEDRPNVAVLQSRLQNILPSFVKWFKEGADGKFEPEEKKESTGIGKDLGKDDEGEGIANKVVENATDPDPAPDVAAVRDEALKTLAAVKEAGRLSKEVDDATFEEDWVTFSKNSNPKKMDSDFAQQEHVQEWIVAFQEAQKKLNEERIPAPVGPRQSAGGEFLFDLIPYGEFAAKFGKSMPKDGMIDVRNFKDKAGETPLQDGFIELMQQIVPEAFVGRKVNAQMLYEKLKDVKVVETVVYGQEGKVSEAKKELDAMTHDWYETLRSSQRLAIDRLNQGAVTGEWAKTALDGLDQEKLATYLDLNKKVKTEPPDTSPRATSYYNAITSRKLEKVKEHGGRSVRIDVQLPGKTIFKGDKNSGGVHDYDNTLGWAWVHELTYDYFAAEAPQVIEKLGLKPGDKVMQVDEQQSRWGQELRSEREETNAAIARGQVDKETAEAHLAKVGAPSHPLLEAQHVLVLKAVISEAQKAGVTKLFVVDKDTALMLEQLDKGHTPENRPEEEGGFDLHYNTTLISAAKKLTGESGVRVDDAGVHQAGINQGATTRSVEVVTNQGDFIKSFDSVAKAEEYIKQNNKSKSWKVDTKPQGSPVFTEIDSATGLSRNKQNISGTVFDLTKAIAGMEQRGGFTLSGKSFAPKPYVGRDSVETKLIFDYGNSTDAMLSRIATESHNPVYRELAAHFQQFKELIGRVTVNWHDAKESYLAKKGRHQGDIYLSSGLLGESAQWREFVMLHEIGHQLTAHQIDNPIHAKTLEKLEALRKTAIDRLPTKLRKIYDKAIESNWYERHVNGEKMELLSQNQDEAGLIYGLLTNKEFASQGWTDSATRNYLATLKTKEKLSGWQKFKSVVKEFMGLAGVKEGTLYDEFLFHTSALMVNGNSVAKYYDYAENFLRRSGVLDPALIDTLTNRTYNLLDVGRNRNLTGREILDWLDPAGYTNTRKDSFETPKMKLTKRELNREIQTKTVSYEELLDIAALNQFEPTVAGLDGYFSEYLRGDREWIADFDYLPSSAKAYMSEKVVDYNNILKLAKATLEKNELVSVAKNQWMLTTVKDAQIRVNKINLMMEKHMQGLELLQTLTEVTTEHGLALAQRVAAPPNKKQREINETLFGRASDGLQTFFEQPAQLSRHNPLFAELYSKSSLLSNNISHWIKEATGAFYADLSQGTIGRSTPESEASMNKALKNGKVKNAVNDWLYICRDMGGDAVRLIHPSTPEVAAVLGKLNQEERAQAIDVMSRVEFSKRNSDLQKRHVMSDEYANVAARYVMSKLKFNPDVAIEAAGVAIDAMTALKSGGDPQLAQAKLAELQSRLGSEAYVGLLEVVAPSVDLLMEQKSHDDANPFWVSAQRGGKYQFEYWFQGKLVRASADTWEEAKHQTGNLKILNWKENKKHNVPDVGFDSQERMARTRLLSDNLRAALEKSGLSAEGLSVFDQLDIATQQEKDYAQAQDAPRGAFKRNARLTKGAEKLPWLENHLTGISKTAAYWNRRLLRAQAETLFSSPDYVNDPDTMSKSKMHIEALLSEDPEMVQKIQKFVTQMSLGGNVSGFLVNGLQPVMRTMPEMIREFGTIFGSGVEIAKASKDYAAHKGGQLDWKTPEENAFYKQALREGKVDATKYDEVQGKFSDSSQTLLKLLKRDIPRTKLQNTTNAVSAVGDWSMGLYRMGERANSTISLMAAFRLAKKQGADFETAKQKAYAIHAAANDVGGRANRPIGMFDNKDKFSRGFFMLSSTLQNYTLGTISQMFRFGHDSFKGATPADRYAARKAAISMGLVQLMAAGALGLPFVGSALALAEEAVPQLEPTKMFREAASWMTGGGESNALTQVLMSGLPSMMGWDFQSRLSIGNAVPGVNEFNGVQPEALAGVPLNMLMNFGKGGAQLLKGDMGGLEKFLPTSSKKLTALLRDDGTLKDYRDQVIYDDVSSLEKLGVAIGFNPKRLSDFNAASRLKERTRVVANEQTARQRQKYAQEVLKGRVTLVARDLKQRAMEDKSFDYEAEVREIAETAESFAFPRDLRAETTGRTGKSQQQVLNMFSLPASRVTEKARIQFKLAIEQRFGLRGNRNRTIRKAEVLDQMAAEHPEWSRSELMQAFESR